MEHFTNGFYFFKRIISEDGQYYRCPPGTSQSFGCVSYLRSGNVAAIEITPEGLHAFACGNAPIECMIITEESSVLKAYPAGRIRGAHGLKINRQNRNTRPQFINTCGVVLSCGEKPVAAALAEKTASLPVSLFHKQEKKIEPPPEKQEKRREEHTEKPESLLSAAGTVFDPFETTNPAYQWFACPEHSRFTDLLTAFSVTLPVTLAKNAREAMAAYGHLLLGSYNDKKTGRSFIIIGIPSDSSLHACAYNDRYEAARWMPAAGHYGSARNTGYHLYYIDAETSAIVKVVVH